MTVILSSVFDLRDNDPMAIQCWLDVQDIVLALKCQADILYSPGGTYQTRNVYPMLFQCFSSIKRPNIKPTLWHHFMIDFLGSDIHNHVNELDYFAECTYCLIKMAQ